LNQGQSEHCRNSYSALAFRITDKVRGLLRRRIKNSRIYPGSWFFLQTNTGCERGNYESSIYEDFDYLPEHIDLLG
jgi:hypothetical protein